MFIRLTQTKAQPATATVTSEAREYEKSNAAAKRTPPAAERYSRTRPLPRGSKSGNENHDEKEGAEVAQCAGFIKEALSAPKHVLTNPNELRAVPGGRG